MTVRSRLLWTIALIGLLLAAPALYGISKLSELRDIATELRGRHAESYLSLGRFHAALVEFDRLQRSYLVIPDPDQYLEVDAALGTAHSELRRLIEFGYYDVVSDASAGLTTIQLAAIEIDSLVRADRVEEATTLFEGVKPIIDQVLNSLGPVATAIDEISTSAADEAERISKTATRVALAALVGVGVVSTALALAATGMLIAPLTRLRAATSAVAAGSLIEPTDLPYDRADEIGDLSRSFRAMTKRLAELDRLKGEFISIASHEFKTPINVIGGYAELMEDGIYGELSDDQLEVMSSIRSQARDLADLADHLLDLGRVEAGNFPIHIEETELRPIFTETERAFRALAVQKRIDFSVELEPDLPETIEADPRRIRQEVLGNLLANAFKFTPEDGSIRVRVTADTALHITVVDNGIGIPEELLPQIFEKFYQVRDDDSGPPPAIGSGLGLAIVREVIEAHGGSVRAESREGEGTSMMIELPISPPDKASRRRLSHEEESVIFRG